MLSYKDIISVTYPEIFLEWYDIGNDYIKILIAKRIGFHMNIPMLNITNQLQILNRILMILIGHPINVSLIGILTIYNTKLYIHLSTQPRLPWAINTWQNLGQCKRFIFSHRIGDNFLQVSLNNFSIHMMALTSIT